MAGFIDFNGKPRKICVRVYDAFRDPYQCDIVVDACAPRSTCVIRRVAKEDQTIRNAILEAMTDLVSCFDTAMQFEIIFQALPHRLKKFALSVSLTDDPAGDKFAQAWCQAVQKGGHDILTPRIVSVS